VSGLSGTGTNCEKGRRQRRNDIILDASWKSMETALELSAQIW